MLLFSCKTKSSEKTLAVVTEDLANIECRAFSLRNERFELANKMRFKQDSLTTIKRHEDSLHIQQELATLTLEKDSILTSSLKLADSIKIQLDYVMKTFLTDKEKEMEFNRTLDGMLSKSGCK